MIDQATKLVGENGKAGDENFKKLGKQRAGDQLIKNQYIGESGGQENSKSVNQESGNSLIVESAGRRIAPHPTFGTDGGFPSVPKVGRKGDGSSGISISGKQEIS